MFSQVSNNKNILIAGLASSLAVIILSAPMAMAWDDDNRSNNRGNDGIIPPYMRDRDNSRNDRDNGRNDGIVPPYIRDRVEANREKGW